MKQTEERLHKPFYYPKERYDDSFISGYSQGIYHMRKAISHLQDQTDSHELQELYLYSLHLIQEMTKTFNTKEK